MFTTDDLAARFRLDVADPLEGADDGPVDSESLWKNIEIFDYMTEAGDAVARETLGLFKLILLPVVADESTVTLPRSVLDIRYARLVMAQRELDVTNQNEVMRGQVVCDYGMQFVGGGRARGTPQTLARDRERKAVVLAPTPVQNDTLELQCSVTLTTPLLCGMPLPFLERPDIRLMLTYMKYLAYAKQDADTLDLTRSNTFKAQFDMGAEDRAVELRRQRRQPSPIRMEW